MPVAQDHGLAQQVRNDVDDAAVSHDVPDAPAVLVPVDHLVVAPPGRQRPGQQVVDLGPYLGGLRGREDVDGEQVTLLVVPANLLDAETPRLLDTSGMNRRSRSSSGEALVRCVMFRVRRTGARPLTICHGSVARRQACVCCHTPNLGSWGWAIP